MLKVFDYEKMPVVEIVNEILVDSSKRGASDIHFDPYAEFLKIRIRIDGQLIDYTEVPNTIKKNLITRIKIISGMNITESRLPQDGAIKTELGGMDLDMPYCCSDADIGIKFSQEGYDNWVVADSIAFHKGSSSTINGKMQSFNHLRGDSTIMFWVKNKTKLYHF